MMRVTQLQYTTCQPPPPGLHGFFQSFCILPIQYLFVGWLERTFLSRAKRNHFRIKSNPAKSGPRLVRGAAGGNSNDVAGSSFPMPSTDIPPIENCFPPSPARKTWPLGLLAGGSRKLVQETFLGCGRGVGGVEHWEEWRKIGFPVAEHWKLNVGT